MGNKLYRKGLVLLSLAFVLAGTLSCIRDEALGKECDITAVSPEWLQSLPSGFLVGNPIVRNRTVTFMVTEGADVTAVAPQFEITPGATLFFVEADGTATPYNTERTRDFTLPQTYRVVSEDGAWSKDYEVSFAYPQPTDECGFEDFTYNDEGQYQRLLQRQTDGSLNANIWDSGNAGYAFTGQAATPLDFPTTFIEDETSLDGRYARLRTLSTGVFGTFVGMPIAAGNLFLGEFQVQNAVMDPLRATRFGLQIVKDEPQSLEGWYRYTAGDVMTGGSDAERDACDIYAVLYEVDPADVVPLFGDDVKTNARIVSIAEIGDAGEPTEWTHFDLPFRTVEGKTFSTERLRSGGYALTIVMSSSREGAFFRGAVGSTLCVDNLKINWKNTAQ
ncbi:MAG: PCMD domain-containing protein [Bacteroidaceae bacterium]|nr:PCMD domain-containing protein [Bacteroidaceae bacterium]